MTGVRAVSLFGIGINDLSLKHPTVWPWVRVKSWVFCASSPHILVTMKPAGVCWVSKLLHASLGLSEHPDGVLSSWVWVLYCPLLLCIVGLPTHLFITWPYSTRVMRSKIYVSVLALLLYKVGILYRDTIAARLFTFLSLDASTVYRQIVAPSLNLNCRHIPRY